MYVKSVLGEQNRTNVRSKKKNLRGVNGGTGTSTADRWKQNGIYTPDSSNGNGYARPKEQGAGQMRIAPWKIILSIIVIGGLGIFYITHVFNTREMLREVQQLERQHEKVKRLNEEYKLRYERLTGPNQIYERAESMGLIHGGPADRIITLQKD